MEIEVIEGCEKCIDWGRTISRYENCNAITCPKCGRLTWPNLGVNCPAGMAVAFGSSNALCFLMSADKLRQMDNMYVMLDGMARMQAYFEMYNTLEQQLERKNNDALMRKAFKIKRWESEYLGRYFGPRLYPGPHEGLWSHSA